MLDILNWDNNTQSSCVLADSSHLDICDPWMFLTQKLWTKNATDLEHYASITNNFNIQESKTYEKTIVSEQAKEWAKTI